jgi:hypothetical protein
LVGSSTGVVVGGILVGGKLCSVVGGTFVVSTFAVSTLGGRSCLGVYTRVGLYRGCLGDRVKVGDFSDKVSVLVSSTGSIELV